MKIKKRIYMVSVLLLIMVTTIIGCSNNTEKSSNTTSETNPNTKILKLNTFLPVDHPFTKDIVPMWIEKVEEATNGEVKVEWIGGPESLPPKDQFDSVRSGLIDIAFSTNSYYGNIVPASDSLTLSTFTPSEERENGYYDYLTELFKENEVIYLGRMISEQPFYLWSNEKVENLTDLKGMRFRASPTYYSMMEKLDITPVEIVASDVYTSLERKMVDGFGFPLLGPRESAWTEVTKHIIKEPFLNQNTTILMNSAAFESLSEESQKNIIEATAEYEKEMVDYFKAENEKEWKTLQESGVKVIEFSSEESEEFGNIWRGAGWEDLENRVPEDIEELKNLLQK